MVAHAAAPAEAWHPRDVLRSPLALLLAVVACGGDDAPTWSPAWQAAAPVSERGVDVLRVAARGDVVVLQEGWVRRWSVETRAWTPPHPTPLTNAWWLVVDDAGGALAVSSTELGDVLGSRLAPGGDWATGWTTEPILRRPPSGSLFPMALAMTGSGLTALAWSERETFNAPDATRIAIHDPPAGWSAPLAVAGVPQDGQLALALADLGAELKLVAAWMEGGAAFASVLHLRRADGQATWEGPTRLVAAAGDFGPTPAVALDRTGAASVLVNDGQTLALIRHTAGGWSAPLVIGSSTGEQVVGASTLVVDPAGPVFVGWFGCLERCTLRIRRWAPAGLGPAVELADTPHAPGPPALAASDGHALAAWTDGPAVWAHELIGGAWTPARMLGEVDANGWVRDVHVGLRWGRLGAVAWTGVAPASTLASTIAIYAE
jgi:hypothetical protein